MARTLFPPRYEKALALKCLSLSRNGAQVARMASSPAICMLEDLTPIPVRCYPLISCNSTQMEESTSYKLNHLSELILMHLAEMCSTRCRCRHFAVGTTLHAPVLLFSTYDACKVRDAGCRPSWRGAQSRIKGGGKRRRAPWRTLSSTLKGHLSPGPKRQ